MDKLVICPQCHNHITVELPDAPRVSRIKRDLYVRRRTGERFDLVLETPADEIVADYTPAVQAGQAGLFGLMAGATAIAGSALAQASPLVVGGAGLMSFLGGSTFIYGILIHGHALKVRLARSLAERKSALAYGREQAEQVRRSYGPTTPVVVERRETADTFARALGDIPCDRDRFRHWATAAIAGDSIAVGKWYGAGRPFSRKEYEAMLEYLRAYPHDTPILEMHGNANRVTRRGRPILRAIVSELNRRPPTTSAAQNAATLHA